MRHEASHEDLLNWYDKHQRSMPWRTTDDPFAIWVSEVMLQQTQVRTVIPYYRRFLKAFPNPLVLAQATQQEVLKLWEGLGYYARARNLHRAAQKIAAQYGGTVPGRYEVLKTLPGIGDYIAAAVASIAFGEPCAVVDGNVKRVLARFQLIDTPVNEPKAMKRFKERAEAFLDRSNPGRFNQAMMELGALVCTPSHPKCPDCPLNPTCRAVKEKAVHEYPKRIKKARIPEYHVAAGIVWKDKKVLITRRKPEGLLGGLWEFPGGKILKGEAPSEACVREIKEEVNLIVSAKERIARVRHAYTHFKIVLDVFRCAYVSGRVKLKGPVDFRWIRLHETEKFPFPGANRKFFPLIKIPAEGV
ncbi:A/G-specific adenine glycosylase [delta proteobacterium NaphS2]|nr:A/G-specific adenine glycosylase [delta proteobacterium NaphS2]